MKSESGDLDRHGKVDVSKSEIVKLRSQDLVTKATAIRDTGTVGISEAGPPDAASLPPEWPRSPAAITSFSNVMSAPRGQVVNRSALREVETDVAALLDDVRDMDDLVVQFGGSEFIEAWKRASIIVDSGGGSGTSPTPPTPPTLPS